MDRKELFKVFKISGLFLSVILVGISTFYFIFLLFDAKSGVYFLDLGMGDAAYIRTPYGQNIII